MPAVFALEVPTMRRTGLVNCPTFLAVSDCARLAAGVSTGRLLTVLQRLVTHQFLQLLLKDGLVPGPQKGLHGEELVVDPSLQCASQGCCQIWRKGRSGPAGCRNTAQ